MTNQLQSPRTEKKAFSLPPRPVLIGLGFLTVSAAVGALSLLPKPTPMTWEDLNLKSNAELDGKFVRLPVKFAYVSEATRTVGLRDITHDLTTATYTLTNAEPENFVSLNPVITGVTFEHEFTPPKGEFVGTAAGVLHFDGDKITMESVYIMRH